MTAPCLLIINERALRSLWAFAKGKSMLTRWLGEAHRLPSGSFVIPIEEFELEAFNAVRMVDESDSEAIIRLVERMQG